MALPFRISREQLPSLLRLGAREAKRFLSDAIRRKGPRLDRALAAVRRRAAEGDPESVLAVLDDFGRNESLLINVGDAKGLLLDEQVLRHQPTIAAELGAFCGYSAVRMGRLMRSWSGHLHSIELSAKSVEISRAVVDFAGLSDVVTFHQGAAADVIPGLQGPLDLVFIDHWKDLYLPDLRRIEDCGLLQPGSVIIADNVTFFDTTDYLEYVRNGGTYDSEYVESTLEYNDDLVDGIEISIRR